MTNIKQISSKKRGEGKKLILQLFKVYLSMLFIENEDFWPHSSFFFKISQKASLDVNDFHQKNAWMKQNNSGLEYN